MIICSNNPLYFIWVYINLTALSWNLFLAAWNLFLLKIFILRWIRPLVNWGATLNKSSLSDCGDGGWCCYIIVENLFGKFTLKVQDSGTFIVELISCILLRSWYVNSICIPFSLYKMLIQLYFLYLLLNLPTRNKMSLHMWIGKVTLGSIVLKYPRFRVLAGDWNIKHSHHICNILFKFSSLLDW